MYVDKTITKFLKIYFLHTTHFRFSSRFIKTGKAFKYSIYTIITCVISIYNKLYGHAVAIEI